MSISGAERGRDPRSSKSGTDPSTSSSSRSVSPAPTLQSLSSSVYENLFDQKHGRIVNSTCATYSMAADDDEIVRMDDEHQLYKFLFLKRYGEELFIGPVHEFLSNEQSGHPEPKRVFDLGTGTAAWAIDMANRFPSTDVVGIDLVPVQPHSDTLPPNCRMEVDDLNLPLDHYYDTASLVHIRLLSSGITDYPGLIDKCSGMLKLGGLLHILETDFRPYSAPHPQAVVVGQVRSRSDPRYSPTVAWLKVVIAAMHQKHANVDAAANIRRWVAEHRCLEEVEYHDEWLPMFVMLPDDTLENRFQNELARRVQVDYKAYLSNARPLLLDSKSAAEVNSLEAATLRELESPKWQIYIRVSIMCARRIPKMTHSPAPLSPASTAPIRMEM